MNARTGLRALTQLSLSLSLLVAACGDAPEPAPTVAVARVIRGGFEIEREDHIIPVRGPTRVEQESTVRTADDGRASLSLDSGGWLLLDRDSELVVELGKVAVKKGRAWVDLSDAEETTIETEKGSVTAAGATFALDVADGTTRVYCGSGEVTYRSAQGDGQLSQGETLVFGDGAPTVEPAEMWDDWTGGLADPTPHATRGPEYIGVLAGRRLDEIGNARTPLPIRGHEVQAVVRGDLVETVVTQTFFNARSDSLEAEYVIRMPQGAIVQGFAVDPGTGFIQGAVGTLATEQGYRLSWNDPTINSSRLSYDGPDRLRARIYPVAPGATVRVQLTYTEWLDRRGDTRTYVYPMASGSEAPLVGEFVLEVDTTGGAVGATRAGMGAEVEGGRVVLRRSDFRPHASFYLDLIDSEERPEDVVHAHVVQAPGEENAEGDERYVLFDVPTESLVEWDDDQEVPPLELVLLVDVSGATDAEDLELARGVVESVLRQLAPTDRVAIQLADVRAHSPEGAPAGLAIASAETREAILESMARAHPGGATDLGESLRQAASLVSGRPRGALLYLGDGIPTTGALDATALRRVLGSVEAPPRFFALAVGDGANIDLLRALFDGQATPVRERPEASRAVMEVLAEAARPTLRGVTVDLGEGVERVYPRPPISIAEGAHLRLVGRLRDDLPEKVTVRATLDGQSFEQELAVQQVQVIDSGDIRRRWAVARLAELLDADAGREALVELGVRFGVVTPWTSYVVGGAPAQPYMPVRGFDRDPVEVAWDVGGRGPVLTVEGLGGGTGWRRRAPRASGQAAALPEATWVSRVDEAAPAGDAPSGDGGLGRASVSRALATGGRGPRGCYERKLTVRPDLRGDVTVQVEVDGGGAVRDAKVLGSTLGAEDVDTCVLTEVRGIRFPATGGTGITVVDHTFTFLMPGRAMGARRQCSDASRQSIDRRRDLWRERLAANAGVGGALSVWREALAQCELGNWRARRTLLRMLLRSVGGVAAQVQLYRAFGSGSSVADYLRRAILRNVRTPQDVMAVRAGLGLDVPVDWSVFSRLWRRNEDPEFRIRLVRRWLEVVPEEMDLRLRLLSLLEQTGKLAEARRLARELRADPLADSRVRTAVGEFWLRQEDEDEARRVFSEIVENAPLDPWARKRLGDLYRAHDWADDAYREYTTLARLRPGDGAVMLDLARAAANAGRTDEALRLEQRLSESAEEDAPTGAATFARLWTGIRLSRMKLAAEDDATRASIRRRERQTGALRDPPALLVLFSWRHPDDAPELYLRHPSTPEDLEWERATLLGGAFGVEAIPVREREEGDYLIELRRAERDRIRDVVGELLLIVAPGTADERIVQREVRLTREERKVRLKLSGVALEPVTIPASEREDREERDR